MIDRYPYMPSLASSEISLAWILSEYDDFIGSFARDEVTASRYCSFSSYLIMYSEERFRPFFNYLNWVQLLGKVVLDEIFTCYSANGVRTRAMMELFEDFVLRVLRESIASFLERELTSGSIVAAIEPKMVLMQRDYLAGGNIPLISAARDGEDMLTPRELEVCRLVAKGLSNKEIAQQTGISVATVKNHVSNVLLKLGLGNRTELSLWYNQS